MNAVSGFSTLSAGLSATVSTSNLFQVNQKDSSSSTLSSSSKSPSNVQISPGGYFKNLMGSFSGAQSRTIEISLSYESTTACAGTCGSESLADELERNLDFILRSVAKNPEDYKRLKQYAKQRIAHLREAMSAHSGAAMASRQAGTVSAAYASVTRIEMNLKITTGQSEDQNTQIEMSDPLILDINGDGVHMTAAGSGALFDINADGSMDATSWVRGDDAFIVMDRNNNGTIDDGSELFGDQNGAPSGFAELAKYDSNGDGMINSYDPVYKALKVYQDMNANGKIESGELSSLEQKGIDSISLAFHNVNIGDNGNKIFLKGSYTLSNGDTRNIVDALLGYRRTGGA